MASIKIKSGSWSIYKKAFVNSSGWKAVSKIWMNFSDTGWRIIWPFAGPYTSISPYISLTRTTPSAISNAQSLKIGGTYYGLKGTWITADYPVSTYLYEFRRHSPYQLPDPLVYDVVASGTYTTDAAAPSITIPSNTDANVLQYEKGWLSFYIKAITSNATIYGEATSVDEGAQGFLYVTRDEPQTSGTSTLTYYNSNFNTITSPRVGGTVTANIKMNNTQQRRIEEDLTEVRWYKVDPNTAAETLLQTQVNGSAGLDISYYPDLNDIYSSYTVKTSDNAEGFYLKALFYLKSSYTEFYTAQYPLGFPVSITGNKTVLPEVKTPVNTSSPFITSTGLNLAGGAVSGINFEVNKGTWDFTDAQTTYTYYLESSDPNVLPTTWSPITNNTTGIFTGLSTTYINQLIRIRVVALNTDMPSGSAVTTNYTVYAKPTVTMNLPANAVKNIPYTFSFTITGYPTQYSLDYGDGTSDAYTSLTLGQLTNGSITINKTKTYTSAGTFYPVVTVQPGSVNNNVGIDKIVIDEPIAAGTVTIDPSSNSKVRANTAIAPTLSGWSANLTYSYQWYLNNAAIAAPSGTAEVLTTSSSALDIGKSYKVTVTGAKTGQTSVSATSPSYVLHPRFPSFTITDNANGSFTISSVTATAGQYYYGTYTFGGVTTNIPQTALGTSFTATTGAGEVSVTLFSRTIVSSVNYDSFESTTASKTITQLPTASSILIDEGTLVPGTLGTVTISQTAGSNTASTSWTNGSDTTSNNISWSGAFTGSANGVTSPYSINVTASGNLTATVTSVNSNKRVKFSWNQNLGQSYRIVYNTGTTTLSEDFVINGNSSAASVTVFQNISSSVQVNFKSLTVYSGLNQTGDSNSYGSNGNYTPQNQTRSRASAATAVTFYTVPGVPGSLTTTDVGTNRPYNNGQISVSWTAPSTGGLSISAYQVDYASSSTPSTWTTLSSTLTSTSTSLSNLAVGSQYKFRVRAQNSLGWGAYNEQTTFTTVTTVPQAPTLSSVSTQDGSLYVVVAAGATGGKSISSYGARAYSGTTLVSSGSNTTTGVTISSLTNGTEYTVVAVISNANGTSTESTSLFGMPLGKPTISLSGITDINITASWSGAGAQVYTVSTNPATSTGTLTDTALTSTTYTQLTPNTNYTFSATGKKTVSTRTYTSEPGSASARTLNTGITPSLTGFTPDLNGYKVTISNYSTMINAGLTVTASATNGSASINASGLVTVTLTSGQNLSTLTVTSSSSTYTTKSATLDGWRKLATPSITQSSRTSTSLTFSWSGTGAASYDVQLINSSTSAIIESFNTTNTSYTFGALTQLTSYQLNVTSRDGVRYSDQAASAWSTIGAALNPTLGTAIGTATGFTVALSNYNASYTYSATVDGGASVGTVSPSSPTANGDLTVTLASGVNSGTLRVTTTRSGYESGVATKTGNRTIFYNVSYNKNTTVVVNSMPASPVSVASGGTHNVSTNTPTRTDGPTFSNSWNTASNGSGTSYSNLGDSFIVTADVTLYAMWTLSAPTLSAATSTSDGFTFTINNYSSTYTYNLSTNSGSISRSGSTVTVSGLSAGASATASVSATINEVTSSPATRNGTALSAPTTPTGFSATTNRTDGVNLTWTAVSNATSYEIYWNTVGGSAPTNSTAADFTGITGTSYLDTGMNSGVSRDYWIRSRNSVGASAWSSRVTGTRVTATYTVTWNANGGSVSTTSSTFSAGGSVTTPTPTRSGYTFVAWRDTPSGDYTYTTGAGVSWSPPSQNITMYARWTASGTAPATPTNGGGTYTTGTNYVTNATFTSSASGTTPITYSWTVSSSTSSSGPWSSRGSGSISSSSLSTTLSIPQQSWNQTTYGAWAQYTVTASNGISPDSGTLTWLI